HHGGFTAQCRANGKSDKSNLMGDINHACQHTINVNASDSNGTISQVDFYAGSTLIRTDAAAPYSLTGAMLLPALTR
ncbi:MAG: Ig-like domain-containing protein, partial [Pyrinomonadaceae bacterium]|nr:Ig-like domain-containing protein [Pyrinomonadaceae bacterium]